MAPHCVNLGLSYQEFLVFHSVEVKGDALSIFFCYPWLKSIYVKVTFFMKFQQLKGKNQVYCFELE